MTYMFESVMKVSRMNKGKITKPLRVILFHVGLLESSEWQISILPPT
jgi:hypothetical protein